MQVACTKWINKFSKSSAFKLLVGKQETWAIVDRSSLILPLFCVCQSHTQEAPSPVFRFLGGKDWVEHSKKAACELMLLAQGSVTEYSM